MNLKPVKGRAAKQFTLANVDLSPRVGRKAYEKRLKALQHDLQIIQQTYLHTGDRAVIVFEGWDAAGKGGAIRRLSAAMDPRGFSVWPIGAPRPYYKQRHYLQRFWERMPPKGAIVVFDRSWYGRVLVERVEGFAQPQEWQRAYTEINEFERHIVDDGMRMVKLFMHITPEEQMERFLARLNEPAKHWKLSLEDFRNRSKWEAYREATNEMVRRTATTTAPWWIVPANQKKFARLSALETICSVLSKGIDVAPRPVDEEIRTLADQMVKRAKV